MQDQLNALKEKGLQELKQLSQTEQLPRWHRQYLSKKGELNQFFKKLAQVSPGERPALGKMVNEVKQILSEQFESHQEQLEEEKLDRSLGDEIDITLPGRPYLRGHLHISTQTLRRICTIFGEMGFQIYQSPEVETDENNFQLLNIPAYHPARDMWDTFWINDKVVLRTHTSPGQIRAMREFYPEPIRIILPGKVYRYEQITPRSEHQFYQIEGLAVGRNIKMTDLIGVMSEFARKMHGSERKIRIRGSYFPFTEPSIEIDMDCILCKSKGCRVCKYSNWLEVAGAGMVHPVVLKNGGYDPGEWNGFAFGLGLERPVMLQHGINDIRYFYGNDLNFLKQF